MHKDKTLVMYIIVLMILIQGLFISIMLSRYHDNVITSDFVEGDYTLHTADAPLSDSTYHIISARYSSGSIIYTSDNGITITVGSGFVTVNSGDHIDAYSNAYITHS